MATKEPAAAAAATLEGEVHRLGQGPTGPLRSAYGTMDTKNAWLTKPSSNGAEAKTVLEPNKLV
jgi:hypothetical protein